VPRCGCFNFSIYVASAAVFCPPLIRDVTLTPVISWRTIPLWCHVFALRSIAFSQAGAHCHDLHFVTDCRLARKRTQRRFWRLALFTIFLM
jgi:hypothetical protein